MELQLICVFKHTKNSTPETTGMKISHSKADSNKSKRLGSTSKDSAFDSWLMSGSSAFNEKKLEEMADIFVKQDISLAVPVFRHANVVKPSQVQQLELIQTSW